MNKVAQITLYFWLLKIMATTLGETAGDMLSMTFNMGYSASLLITSGILIVLLIAQISAKKFNPLLFWAAIIGTTTVGTEISDFLDRTLHMGYFYGSLFLLTGLSIVLILWHLKEKNLRVYPIERKGLEIFYWSAVLFSNSLGTAFGDLLSDDLGFSYAMGAIITSAIIGFVVWLHYKTKINTVLLFWVAFIFTRPFGATFGDFLTKPLASGGLDLGTVEASSITLLLFSIVLFFSHKHFKQID